MLRTTIPDCNRIVIKVGTSSLTYPNGMLNLQQIDRLVRSISDIHNSGKDVILVTSGAIGAGMMKLGVLERPVLLPEKQAIAAVGQGLLMHIYEKLFSEYAKTVAQVLLTRSDTQDRVRCANSRNTLQALLRMKVIPIINENDAVSIDELKIGDNDNLSAMVATFVEADLLIILSDIDGLYNCNPTTCPDAKLLDQVKSITSDIEAMAGNAGSKGGTGGMITKIQAAKIAVNAGVAVVIAKSSEPDILQRILNGAIIGTYFVPKRAKLLFRKKWLSFGKACSGKITIDEGCARAILDNGSSLLAVGIRDVCGNFEAGSVISIVANNGQEIAKGLTNYSRQEIDIIKGKRAVQIAQVLGNIPYHEVIHRDNMVVII